MYIKTLTVYNIVYNIDSNVKYTTCSKIYLLGGSSTNLFSAFFTFIMTMCPPTHLLMLTTRSPTLPNTKFLPIVTLTILSV